MTTAQKLGYSETDRLLIINADDFGASHTGNESISHLLEEGALSSATIMMPCGWAREAARWSAAHPEHNIGIHLTFTSEWENHKWGPVTRNAGTGSLTTAEGYFPADCLTFEKNADPQQVRIEIVQQIELAIAMGIDPTHLDNHMGSLYGLRTGRDFLDIVFDVCAAYKLPFRMPRYLTGQYIQPAIIEIAAARAGLADTMGVLIPDYLMDWPYAPGSGESYEEVKQRMIATLRALNAGVSELIIHPSLVTEELKAMTPHYAWRGIELALCRDAEIRQVIEDENIKLIRWSDLREAQRGQ
ncbi:polysaccharide deacetylase family protein [Paenibacillus sp. FJAT-26967]|uniref:polysaccharide deacetylase family protein n=1 Tax=Paenibacillus sp. FJAT-26967 TaxID=1729690 RepID=UPI0008383DA6|nr:polysaccharide deacetylase family protein [Paenibacillus sp. FJAT-26967]